MENEEKILAFWQWFVKSESIIKECIENENSTHKEYVVDQLNELILSIGIFSWDIGLDDDDNWFLMISPNGEEDMFKLSKAIMSYAPEHMDWLFYSSRQPLNWNREFTVYDTEMDEVTIDANNWHVLIIEDEQENLELILEAKNISHLDEETSGIAVEQFLVKEIGEAKLMESISSLSIVEEMEKEHQEVKVSVLELREVLQSV